MSMHVHLLPCNDFWTGIRTFVPPDTVGFVPGKNNTSDHQFKFWSKDSKLFSSRAT